MEYKVFKNKNGDILLQVFDGNLASSKVNLINLNASLREGAKEWIYIELNMDDYIKLTPAGVSIKQNALKDVCERMKRPTPHKNGWGQIKLFLENSLKV